jgi:hypothetical protein
MRAIYETPEDKERERAAVAAFAARYGLDTVELPPRYPVDFAVVREGDGGLDEVTAFGEVKIRSNPADRYPTAILGAAKWAEAITLAERTGCKLILLYGWDSGKDIRWVELTKLTNPPRIAPGGRTDRGDNQDEEPVVHIPVELFRHVSSSAPERYPAPASATASATATASAAAHPSAKPAIYSPDRVSAFPAHLKTMEEKLQHAKDIASQGGDVGIMFGELGGDYSARLRIFVQGLPEDIRRKTIFGRSNPPTSKRS